MSEMIERIARVLCKASGVDPDSSDACETRRYGKDCPNGIMTVGRYENGWHHSDTSLKPCNPSGISAWRWFVPDACAVIESMCEPTAEMCLDGSLSADDLTSYGAEQVWKAMIYTAKDRPGK